jgi:hypothetical protein
VNWSATPPSKPGWYWVSLAPGLDAIIVKWDGTHWHLPALLKTPGQLEDCTAYGDEVTEKPGYVLYVKNEHAEYVPLTLESLALGAPWVHGLDP